MLPDLPRLLAGYELFAQRNAFPPVRDDTSLASALEDATSLACGHEPDEPAALSIRSPDVRISRRRLSQRGARREGDCRLHA